MKKRKVVFNPFTRTTAWLRRIGKGFRKLDEIDPMPDEDLADPFVRLQSNQDRPSTNSDLLL